MGGTSVGSERSVLYELEQESSAVPCAHINCLKKLKITYIHPKFMLEAYKLIHGGKF